MFKKQKNKLRDPEGFTLIELLIVVVVIAILATIGITSYTRIVEEAHFTRAKKELQSINASLEFYKNDNNGEYPPDSSRSIPPGLEEYLLPGVWPTDAWPGSVTDWENWEEPGTGEKIYQISIRFCPVGQPDECRFPGQEWAENFDINSSVFRCLEGPCRSHINRPPDHPGYCVNCVEPQYPYGIY